MGSAEDLKPSFTSYFSLFFSVLFICCFREREGERERREGEERRIKGEGQSFHSCVLEWRLSSAVEA